MNIGRDDVLTQAYQLIEADKLEEAKAILKPVLETDKNNPDVWWLYAHAVTDSETARIALNNVIRLDNDYPEASDLLKTLEQHSPAEGDFDSQREPSFLPTVPATLPDLPASGSRADEVDLPDDFADSSRTVPIYQRPSFLMAIIGLLLVIAVVIVIVRPFGNGANPSSTQTVDQNTPLSPTLANSSQSVDTLVSPTISGNFDSLKSSLAAFKLADNGINVSDTSLGNTLLVKICTSAGREMRTLLPQVMDALAKATDSYSNQVAAIGVHMIDCNSNADLLTIGVSATDAAAYASGTLSEQDFQSRWKPVA